MSAVPKFTWSDAWLLHSVAVAGGDKDGATLAGIIRIGDAINHAIFTAAELRRGFGKLTAAGYLSEVDGRFRLSGGARVVWTKAVKFQALDRQRREIDAFLKPDPYPAGDPGAEDPAWPYPLTDSRIAEAETDYRRHLSKGIKEKGCK